MLERVWGHGLQAKQVSAPTAHTPTGLALYPSQGTLTGVEENTLIASLCDMLERVWGHGLQAKQVSAPTHSSHTNRLSIVPQSGDPHGGGGEHPHSQPLWHAGEGVGARPPGKTGQRPHTDHKIRWKEFNLSFAFQFSLLWYTVCC